MPASLKEWDVTDRMELWRVEGHARMCVYYAKRIREVPDWMTKAEDALVGAQAAVEEALAILRAGRKQHGR